MTNPHFVRGLSFDASRLAERRKTLGASEIAAVAGLDRYRTPLNIFLEKIGEAAPFAGSEASEWGLRLEEAIAGKYADAHPGYTVVRNPDTMVSTREPWMSATPDFFVIPPEGERGRYGLQVKNKGARQIIHWGESGTDQIPDEIAAQVHWEMDVAGLPRNDVIALFGGNESRIYPLRFNEQIADSMREIGRAFWFGHVVARVQPPIDGTEASSDLLRRMFATHGERVRAATKDEDALVSDLMKARDALDRIEAQKSFVENKLKAAIGEDAGIISRFGRCTWKKTKDSETTNWQEVVGAMRTLLAMKVQAANREQNPNPYADADAYAEIGNALRDAITQYTTTKPGYRRFLPTPPKQD